MKKKRFTEEQIALALRKDVRTGFMPKDLTTATTLAPKFNSL